MSGSLVNGDPGGYCSRLLLPVGQMLPVAPPSPPRLLQSKIGMKIGMVLQLYLVRMSWRTGPPPALTMGLTKPRGCHSLALVFVAFKAGGNASQALFQFL